MDKIEEQDFSQLQEGGQRITTGRRERYDRDEGLSTEERQKPACSLYSSKTVQTPAVSSEEPGFLPGLAPLLFRSSGGKYGLSGCTLIIIHHSSLCTGHVTRHRGCHRKREDGLSGPQASRSWRPPLAIHHRSDQGCISTSHILSLPEIWSRGKEMLYSCLAKLCELRWGNPATLGPTYLEEGKAALQRQSETRRPTRSHKTLETQSRRKFVIT